MTIGGPGFALGIMHEGLGRLLDEAVRGTPGEGAAAVMVCVNDIERCEVMSRRVTCCKCRGPGFVDALLKMPEGTAYLCISCAPVDAIRALLVRAQA